MKIDKVDNKRCGKCDSCKSVDCGSCDQCLQMEKFGGEYENHLLVSLLLLSCKSRFVKWTRA